MCIAPITLSTGLQTSCHKCWQCVERGIDDWVGRCIAETKTSDAAFAVTLTYGRDHSGLVDHPHAALLIISDVQKYLKLIRRHGYNVRYLLAGEYGTLKGRAHWHLILFFKGKVPPHELGKRFMQEHWPHGYSFWERPQAHAIRYVCKYVQKDLADPRHQGKLTMSKKPPLGTAYFAQVAAKYVKAGLAPQDLSYRFPDVTRRKKRKGITVDEVIEFRLKDKAAELYVQFYIDAWRQAYGNDRWPESQLVDNYKEYGRIVLDPDRLAASEVVPDAVMAERVEDAKNNPTVTDAQRAAARRRKAPPDDMTGWPYNDPEWIKEYIDGQQDGQHKPREDRQSYESRVSREQAELFGPLGARTKRPR